MLVNMSEEEWDSVVAVHIKGTFNVTRHANAYFRGLCKADPKLKFPGRIINTASDAGLRNLATRHRMQFHKLRISNSSTPCTFILQQNKMTYHKFVKSIECLN